VASQDFTKNLNTAIHASSEKFITMYVEESMKGDLKFKMQMKPFDFGTASPVMTKGLSSMEG
jgi:hypothetical protein